jgi:hypothetical protein
MTILTIVAALVAAAAAYTLFVYLMFKDVHEIIPNDKLKKK